MFQKLLAACVIALFGYSIFLLIDRDRALEKSERHMRAWCILILESDRHNSDLEKFHQKTKTSFTEFSSKMAREHGSTAQAIDICLNDITP